MDLMHHGHSLNIEKRDFSGGFSLYYQLASCPEACDLKKILMMAYYSSYWTGAGVALSPDSQSVFLTQFFNSPLELITENTPHSRFIAGVGMWKDVISGSRETPKMQPNYNFIDGRKLEVNIRKKILTPP